MITNVTDYAYLCKHKTYTNYKKTGISLVNKLEKYLKDRSITQRGFARKIGMSYIYLGLLVRGKSTPSLELAYKIEKETGGVVTLYDWVNENEVEKQQKNDT